MNVFKITFVCLFIFLFFKNLLIPSFKKYFSCIDDIASPKSERPKNTFLYSKLIIPFHLTYLKFHTLELTP